MYLFTVFFSFSRKVKIVTFLENAQENVVICLKGVFLSSCKDSNQKKNKIEYFDYSSNTSIVIIIIW